MVSSVSAFACCTDGGWLLLTLKSLQATAAAAGVAIGVAAYASRYLINAGVKWANAPAKMRAFYKVQTCCGFLDCLHTRMLQCLLPSAHEYVSLVHLTFLTPRNCCQGGFQSSMTRREAALILGIRETAAEERVKEAHRKIMIANHPDAGIAIQTLDLSAAHGGCALHRSAHDSLLHAGGSSYIASKVNEAKDMLMGKGQRGSVF